MKPSHFIGSRVVKTGVAVFLTAWICELFDAPAVFAVITAIVTIEPTVSDSIRKGFVRFPASAIGAAYSVFFIYLFGNSPITYALAATLTIVTCFRLKLHAGLLVATLTAVAMVEVIHSNYFISFLIRLGTTTIGLVVSTAVNMFVLPPDYTSHITENMMAIRKRLAAKIEKVFYTVTAEQPTAAANALKSTDVVYKKIRQTETLIQFQKEEAKYHPLTNSEKRFFKQVEKQLTCLKLIHYHIDNVVTTRLRDDLWHDHEKKIIRQAADELVDTFNRKTALNQTHIRELRELYWRENGVASRKPDASVANFPPELIITYELLTICQLTERFLEYGKHIKKHPKIIEQSR
ncbi:aromatic acid exporter family protein [Virgibacillus pantothenticus]|uniref:aromatic acid exporter family protein n=1 Tax=Virgibacillus pantothenticus TaxID=1473 RepID=UPI000984BBB4|nr:aromatic acid exporter family protein [Virgibacillus pantothenticus]